MVSFDYHCEMKQSKDRLRQLLGTELGPPIDQCQFFHQRAGATQRFGSFFWSF
jgi:hypothetical protein